MPSTNVFVVQKIFEEILNIFLQFFAIFAAKKEINEVLS